ncbi:DNA (cytosine-5-)-methyltransferase [Tatumella saanichensis]|uniref:DNA (cytosine-5-)-methyltransferase n=1 Tax=Tatumella saanichensis TaxID=480813 RepID=UPI0004ACCF9C|nr:DNA (cytosine-5-)-methyltransferase [Tatumella saanichensis]
MPPLLRPTPNEIIAIRTRLGLGRAEFANVLGMPAHGEQTVIAWEAGTKIPPYAKRKAILNMEHRLQHYAQTAPFRREPQREPFFRFIDLFAGIGGIRLPFQQRGGHCVFTSEWDKYAQKTYLANYGEMPVGDITRVRAADIPDHDILLGGFPCQAFSLAGRKQGFSDTRGTMFFEIQRILAEKRPKAFLLENVKQLRGHDQGRTLKTIINILQGTYRSDIPDDIALSEETRQALSDQLNYHVEWRVLRAGDFGAPQNRERIYIVGFDKNYFSQTADHEIFRWPEPPCTPTRVGDILLSDTQLAAQIAGKRKDFYTLSDKLWRGHQNRLASHQLRGNGFGYSLFNADSEYANTLSARYYKDGSEILIDQTAAGKNPRKLTPRECARLQGFPDTFIVDAVSHGQIYKQLGNSVCMNVIEAIASEMVAALSRAALLSDKETAA